MKTLILTLEYPPQIGGIALYTFNLASHLPSNEVVVYAPKMAGDTAFDSNNSWKTYRFHPYFFLIWPRWLRLLIQVWSIVKTEKIEHVYVNHALPSGYVAKIIWKLKKIPYTIFFHGTDLELGTKYKRRKLLNVCRTAEKIVINSKYLRNKLQTRLEGVSDDKVIAIQPCPADYFFDRIDSAVIVKRKSELGLEGRKVILSVGRLAEGKGFPLLAATFQMILREIPTAVWLIAGDGPKREELFKIIDKAGLQNAVRFVGKIEYTSLPLYYQMADIFVMLTHPDEANEESWGTVFTEAAATGLPAIAGRVGGVEEVVINGETGLIVDAYQSAETAKAIVGLLKDEARLIKMGAAAKQRAESEFRWEKQVAKLTEQK